MVWWSGSLTGTSTIVWRRQLARIVDECRLGWLALLLGLSGPLPSTQAPKHQALDADPSYLTKHLLLACAGRGGGGGGGESGRKGQGEGSEM